MEDFGSAKNQSFVTHTHPTKLMSSNVQHLQQIINARKEQEGNDKFMQLVVIAMELPFIIDEAEIKQMFGNGMIAFYWIVIDGSNDEKTILLTHVLRF